MLKQKLTPYTGQLLACRTSGWSAECIGLPWNTTLITPHLSLSLLLTPTALTITCADDRFRVVQNINLFEKKLSEYGYASMSLYSIRCSVS